MRARNVTCYIEREGGRGVRFDEYIKMVRSENDTVGILLL